jgi:hypothetical protein
MRFRTAAALCFLLTLGLAGCARGPAGDPAVATAHSADPAAGARPSSTASKDPDAPLKFSQCMRAHGLPWFPDPDSGGRLTVRTPAGVDRKKVDAAQRACAVFAPDAGPGADKPTAAEMEQLRQVSRCMRAHGIANFPDPTANGAIQIDRDKLGTGPGDPAFDKAQQACDKSLPKVTGGGGQVRSGGGQ